MGPPGVSPANANCENCAALEPPWTGGVGAASPFISEQILIRAAAVAEQNPVQALFEG
jgi:hypothetical protein